MIAPLSLEVLRRKEGVVCIVSDRLTPHIIQKNILLKYFVTDVINFLRRHRSLVTNRGANVSSNGTTAGPEISRSKLILLN